MQQLEVVCRGLETIDGGDWRKHQEHNTDHQPMLQWVEEQRKPPWEEVAALHRDVKGLWAKFGVLRLCRGVLQQAWKEPATGEERWQVVVPKGLQGCSRQCMEPQGRGTLGLLRHSDAYPRVFTGAGPGGMSRTFAGGVTPAPHGRAPPGAHMLPFSSFWWAHLWRGWR